MNQTSTGNRNTQNRKRPNRSKTSRYYASSDNRLNESRGAGADNTGRRREYDKEKKHRRNHRSGRSNRSGGSETLADIKSDIAGIEKEIALEIREIRELMY